MEYASLKGINSLSEPLLSDQLETNCLAFFQQAFLNAGAFFNVQIPTTGVYGGHWHGLRPVKDPNYTDGQVWQGARKDWVWETGINYAVQPIRVSGVYLDGVFRPISGTGYTHHVDYPNGRVIFDNPISTGTAVTCEYSYRWHQWYTADALWWQEAQLDSFRVDSPQYSLWASGDWSVLSQNRVQLPAVVVEASPQTSRYPLQIGSLVARTSQEILFHILCEHPWDRKQLHDAITAQWKKRLLGFDKGRLLEEGRFPLNYDGSPNSSGLMYPDLIKGSGEGGFFWKQIRLEDMRSYDYRRFGRVLYCIVRATCEVDMP